jgi:two-component system, LytTR family, sensor kinase
MREWRVREVREVAEARDGPEADARDWVLPPRSGSRTGGGSTLGPSPLGAAGPVESRPVLPSLLTLRVTWQVLAWWTAFYGLASWFLEYAFSQLDPATAMPFWFGLNRVVYAVMWTWALLVAIVSTERVPVTSRRQVRRILLHVGLAIAVSILWGVVGYYVCLAVVPGWVPMGVPRMLASTTKVILFGYGLAVVLIHILLQVRIQRHQEVMLLRQAHLATEAQLQVLKLELQPHFLFNALNAVSAQIPTDPQAANATLVLVSDMLREAIETTRVQEVTLREELATLRPYTQLQQVRFGDRLRLTWDVEEAALDAAVPHLLLQPLVENAIKHGLEADSTAGRIVVSARCEGERLRLRIWNDGPGQRVASPRRGTGVGLTNVRSRLAQLYGERQAFDLSDAPGGGTQVTIELPFLTRRAGRVDGPDAAGAVEPPRPDGPGGHVDPTPGAQGR